jgi:hypothetical protein
VFTAPRLGTDTVRPPGRPPADARKCQVVDGHLRRDVQSARCRAVGITPEMPVAESEQGSRPIRSRVREQRSALPDHAYSGHPRFATPLHRGRRPDRRRARDRNRGNALAGLERLGREERSSAGRGACRPSARWLAIPTNPDAAQLRELIFSVEMLVQRGKQDKLEVCLVGRRQLAARPPIELSLLVLPRKGSAPRYLRGAHGAAAADHRPFSVDSRRARGRRWGGGHSAPEAQCRRSRDLKPSWR